MSASGAHHNDYHVAFMLGFFLVYYAEAIESLDLEELKKVQKLIKYSIAITTVHPELEEILEIFNEAIRIREETKDTKTLGQKFIEVIQWIGMKLLNFFSFLCCKAPRPQTTPNDITELKQNKPPHTTKTFLGLFSSQADEKKPITLAEIPETATLKPATS